jgi:hypothetical protein
MYTHEEILAYQKRIIALEEECEIYAESAHQFCKLAEEMVDYTDSQTYFGERLSALHTTERGPTSAEALLEFARKHTTKTEPDSELGIQFDVVAIVTLEAWVIEERKEDDSKGEG